MNICPHNVIRILSFNQKNNFEMWSLTCKFTTRTNLKTLIYGEISTLY